MGAHLYYRAKNQEDIDKIGDWLFDESKKNRFLIDIGEAVSFYTTVDIEWAKKERPDLVSMMEREFGTGSIKTSGGVGSEAEEAGLDEEDILEKQTEVFEDLNEKFEMKYYAGSCAFTLEEDYFSIEQMKRITKNGTLLSGRNHKNYHALFTALSVNANTLTESELYSGMSFKEKSENVHLIRLGISDRAYKVTNAISDETKIVNLFHYADPIIIREFADLSQEQESNLRERGDGNIYSGDRLIGQTIFGVKDIFQPIEDYIKEIKESAFYKFFVSEVSNKVGTQLSTDPIYHAFAYKFKTLDDINSELSKADKISTLEDKLLAIKPFVGESQYSVLTHNYKSKSYEFVDVVNELYSTITTMAKTYEQDGKGKDAIAYLHYFHGNSDWYILEKDIINEQVQAFGFVVLNSDYDMAELGYISIPELTALNVELDLYWDKTTLGEIKSKHSREYEASFVNESNMAVDSDEPMEYRYGMRIRPFMVGAYPKNDSFIGVYDGEKIEGRKYHNILKYSSPLTEAEVKSFELDDLAKIAMGGLGWENIVKTTNYLAKKDFGDKFMTDNFYNQIQMNEDDFYRLMVKNGYDDPMDFYDEVAKNYTKESPQEIVHTANTDKPKEVQLKLTPYIRKTEKGEELYQIKSIADIKIDGKTIPSGTHGGWISSLDRVGENSWFSKDVQVWDGVVIEPNTYLDAQIHIKSNEDIVVAKAMTNNKGSREANNADNGLFAKQGL